MTTFKNGLAKHESGFYHYCFRHEGEQFKGSTRAKDLATAKRVMAERRKDVLLSSCGIHKAPIFSALVSQWLKTHKAVFSKKHWVDVECVSRN